MLSRAAALQILARRESLDCDPLNAKWAERTHQGGDAWLGDCADASGVHIDMEYGFYPQPPVANMFQVRARPIYPHPHPNPYPYPYPYPKPKPKPKPRTYPALQGRRLLPWGGRHALQL